MTPENRAHVRGLLSYLEHGNSAMAEIKAGVRDGRIPPIGTDTYVLNREIFIEALQEVMQGPPDPDIAEGIVAHSIVQAARYRDVLNQVLGSAEIAEVIGETGTHSALSLIREKARQVLKLEPEGTGQ